MKFVCSVGLFSCHRKVSCIDLPEFCYLLGKMNSSFATLSALLLILGVATMSSSILLSEIPDSSDLLDYMLFRSS